MFQLCPAVSIRNAYAFSIDTADLLALWLVAFSARLTFLTDLVLYRHRFADSPASCHKGKHLAVVNGAGGYKVDKMNFKVVEITFARMPIAMRPP